MNALRQLQAKPTFTREELQGLDQADLAALEQYTPGLTSISVRLQKMVGKRAPNLADQALIAEVRLAKKSGTILSCGHFDELTWSKGGQVRYTPEKISIELTGKTIEVRNSPIPSEADSDRVGFDMMRVQVCTFFAFSKGFVIRVVPEADWHNRFGWEGSHMRTVGLSAFEAVVKDVFSRHPSYQSLVDAQKTLSGRDFFQFVAESLKLCPISDYYALHDTYITDMLHAVNIEMRGDQVQKITRKTSLNSRTSVVTTLVPPQSYTLAKSPDTQEFFSIKKRYPFILLGPLPTAHKFFAIKGTTLDFAVKAMMNGNALRGGHSQGVGLMVSACGFSGMQSDRVRRISTLASMALVPLMRKEKVDIRVEAQDIPPLALTFAHHMPPVEGKRTYDVRYVVSSIHLSSLGEYEVYASTSERPEAIFVFIDDEVCPSISVKKNVTEEWTLKGKKKLERYSRSSRFIGMCAILSEDYFKTYSVSYHAPPAEFFWFLNYGGPF